MNTDALAGSNLAVSDVERIPPLQRTGLPMRRLLALCDIAALSLAFVITEFTLGVGSGRSNRLPDGQEYLLFALSIPVWVFLANLHGLYDRDGARADHGPLMTSAQWSSWSPSVVGPWLARLGLQG